MAPRIRVLSAPPTIIRFVTTPLLMTLNLKKLSSSRLKLTVIMPVTMVVTLQKTVSALTLRLCHNFNLLTHRSEVIGARSNKYSQQGRSSAFRATTRVIAQQLRILTYLLSLMSGSE